MSMAECTCARGTAVVRHLQSLVSDQIPSLQELPAQGAQLGAQLLKVHEALAHKERG